MVLLGRTGTTVSELAFRTWRSGQQGDDGAIEVGRGRIHELLDAYAVADGDFIDTADMYGDGASEMYVDEWLGERDREEFVVMSRIFWFTREDANGRGLNRKYPRRQIDRILDRLGIDYIDLLYIHRWDNETSIEEFIRTLDGFVRDGRVNCLGISTLESNAWKVVKADEPANKRGYEPFKVVQPRYNAVNREIEGNYLDTCADYDIGIVPWSPLTDDFFTGKYVHDERSSAGSRTANDQRSADSYLMPADSDALEQAKGVAEAVDASPAQVSLAWLIHHLQVIASIVGARTVDQLGENVVAVNIDPVLGQFKHISAAKCHSSA